MAEPLVWLCVQFFYYTLTTVEFSPLLASPFHIHTIIKSFWLELHFQSNDDKKKNLWWWLTFLQHQIYPFTPHGVFSLVVLPLWEELALMPLVAMPTVAFEKPSKPHRCEEEKVNTVAKWCGECSLLKIKVMKWSVDDAKPMHAFYVTNEGHTNCFCGPPFKSLWFRQ